MDTDTVPQIADGPSGDLAAVVLPDRVRRRVVTALANRTAPVAVTELAAALEGEGDEAGISDRRNCDLEIALHHVHLPKLDDVGVLDYDPATSTVTATRTARFGAVLSGEY